MPRLLGWAPTAPLPPAAASSQLEDRARGGLAGLAGWRGHYGQTGQSLV